MSASYTLDTKIAALNLLTQFDDDFNRVKAKLEIPLKTLRGWHADETQLRHKYEDRQYRYISNIKLHLLVDMVEFARDIMTKLKSGDREDGSLSQLTYTLGTLLTHAGKLEQNFEYLPQDPGDAPEPPNRIEYIYDGGFHDLPPWENAIVEESLPPQNIGLRAALEQFGISSRPEPESSPPEAQALLFGDPQPPDSPPDPARPAKQRQRHKRRRHRSKRKAR